MRSAKHSEIRAFKLRVPSSSMPLKVREKGATVRRGPNCGVPSGLLVTGSHEQFSLPPQIKNTHVILRKSD